MSQARRCDQHRLRRHGVEVGGDMWLFAWGMIMKQTLQEKRYGEVESVAKKGSLKFSATKRAFDRTAVGLPRTQGTRSSGHRLVCRNGAGEPRRSSAWLQEGKLSKKEKTRPWSQPIFPRLENRGGTRAVIVFDTQEGSEKAKERWCLAVTCVNGLEDCSRVSLYELEGRTRERID